MVKILNHSAKDFKKKLHKLLETKSETSREINSVVERIIIDVAKNGDSAVLKYTKKFDKWDASASTIKVTEKEISQAYNNCDKQVVKSLELAAKRVESYHQRQKPNDLLYIDDIGVKLGWKWTPVDSAGLYIPGGLAAYPSTVLMNAIPAKIAGVSRLAMVVPSPQGKISELVLTAAKICGVNEIYKIGGAQAIAALAYGTKTVKPVDKIAGPGNAYVAAAKRQMFSKVGIDMVAGPSEILIISDKNSNPRWIAADLLSQAEHDKTARSILITDDKNFAKSVITEVNKILKNLPRKEIAGESWKNYGLVITTSDLEKAAYIANIIATEHLELCVDEPEKLVKLIRNAGAIFIGRHTPEPIGDYIAGPSHVLPTAGSARFSSGLSVLDFMKRTSIISCSPESFAELARDTELLAEQEGLYAHAVSIKIRAKNSIK